MRLPPLVEEAVANSEIGKCRTYQAMKFTFKTAKGYDFLIAAACIHETVVGEMDSARCRAPRGLVRAPICIAKTLQDPLTLSWFWSSG